MYENTIRIARPHVSHACESMPCGKTERNINARALTNYFNMNKTIDVQLYLRKPAVECMQIFFVLCIFYKTHAVRLPTLKLMTAN